MARATMFFPRDFLWGTATSSHQVEGNNNNNDWWAWEQKPGRILNEDKSGLACDWWANAERDLDAAAALHNNAHRLSLEWSRIEPEPSLFDNEAIGRYREILQGMHERGLEPMVTLHHFTNPLWLAEKGDFSTDIIVDYFQRYTAKVVEKLGDLIPKWVTINEPMVYAFFRYLEGVFPAPKQMGLGAAFQALSNMLRCHAAAYHTIKDTHPEALVGVARHLRPIMPRAESNSMALDRWWARRVDWLFNEWWMDCMRSGRLRWPARGWKVQHLAGSYDFIGINYYSRSLVRFPKFQPEACPPDAVLSDMDFLEVYPEGLYQVIHRSLPYNKPIYITENGLPDKDDRLRSAFLIQHLHQVWRAINFNFPVMGYYHWSLVDNFEWDRGWAQRFGLIELNVETQERKLRESGRLYSDICQQYCLNSTLTEQYAPELMSVLFPG